MYKKMIFFLLMQTVFGASLTENEEYFMESLPINPINDENASEIKSAFNEMGETMEQDLLAPQNITSKNSSILISTLHHGRIADLASYTNPSPIPSDMKDAEPSEVSVDSTFISSLPPINSSVTQSNISYEPLDAIANDLIFPAAPVDTTEDSSLTGLYDEPNLTMNARNYSGTSDFHEIETATLSEETSDFKYPSVAQTADFQFSATFLKESTEQSDFFHTDSSILPVSSTYKFSDVPNLTNSIASSKLETEALSDISSTLQNPDKVSKIQFESQVQKVDTASRTKTIAEVDETIVEMTEIESSEDKSFEAITKAKEKKMSELKLTEADTTLLESNVRLTKANATKTKENATFTKANVIQQEYSNSAEKITKTDHANAATDNANETKTKETNKNVKTKVAKIYSTSTRHAKKTSAESTKTEANKNVNTSEEREINTKLAMVGSGFNGVAEKLVFDARITIEIIDEFKESFVSELLARTWSEAETIYPLGSVNEPFLIPVPDLESRNIANLTMGLLESYQMLQQYAVALEHLTLDLVLSSTHGYMYQVTEVSRHLEFTLDDLKISILDHGLVPFNDKTYTVVYKYPDLPSNQSIRDFAILRDTRVALQDVQNVFSDL